MASEYTWWEQSRAREAAFDEIIQPVRAKAAEMIERELGLSRVWGGHFGATGIHPRHLAAHLIVPMRADVDRLKASPLWDRIRDRLRADLQAGGHPVEALQGAWLECFSEQQCDEEADGNWYYFFK